MSITLWTNYGPYFEVLSAPEQRAVMRYLEAFEQLYPELAGQATAGPGNDQAVYVYAPFPASEDESIQMSETMSKVGLELLEDTGVLIVLMPR
jgi:hypothetical protein